MPNFKSIEVLLFEILPFVRDRVGVRVRARVRVRVIGDGPKGAICIRDLFFNGF